MATIPKTKHSDEIRYPVRDGKPIGETPIHRDNLVYSVWAIRRHFATDPMVYVSGNMFLYYVEGDKRRHVSPDVFVVRGIPNHYRDAYFTWRENGRTPDLVIEMTSGSTRDEDLKRKFALYRDVLRVREYFLFDPKGDYLDPQLQGHRLVDGRYVPISPIDGRLPSEILGLHFEGPDEQLFLRIYDPVTEAWIPLPDELEHEFEQTKVRLKATEAKRKRAQTERERAETERDQLKRELEQSEAERQRLLAAIEAMKRGKSTSD